MTEDIALSLERKGFWRRAAKCWLELQRAPELTDVQRENLRKKRQRCLEYSHRKESGICHD